MRTLRPLPLMRHSTLRSRLRATACASRRSAASRIGGFLVFHPAEMRLDIQALQTEPFEVPSEAFADFDGWASGLRRGWLGHVTSHEGGLRTPWHGSASYSARSRGSVQLCVTAPESFLAEASATYSSSRRRSARAIRIRSIESCSKAP